MKGIVALLLLAMVALFNTVECANPGITTAVNLGAINGLIGKILPPAVHTIRNTPIPNVHEKQGRETTDVTGIRLYNFDIGAITLRGESSNVVVLDINKLNIGISANIKYKKKRKRWISKKFSCGADARIYDSNIVVKFSVDSLNGQPKVNIHSANLSLRKFKLKIKKKWYSFLVNLMLRIFRGKIKNVLVKAVNTTFRSSLQTIADGLTASAHVKKVLPNLGFINLALVNGVYVQNNNIIAGLDGEITPNYASMNTPRHAISMPDNHSHFAFLLDTAVFQSLLNTMRVKNVLSVVADASNTRGLPVSFVASSWAPILPGMYKYGESPMRAVIVSGDYASVSADTNKLNFQYDTLFDYQVLQNGQWVHCFTIHNRFDFGVNLSLGGAGANQQVLSLQISKFTNNLIMGRTSVGTIDFTLKNIGDALISEQLIVPILNKFLVNGIPLPSIDALGFKNLRFNILKDSVFLATDLIY